MPAFIVARVHVTDWPRYQEYMRVTPGIIAAFGGRFIARGGETITLEGPEERDRLVILEFPSLTAAKAFFYSDAYKQAQPLRENAATVQFVAIDGVENTAQAQAI